MSLHLSHSLPPDLWAKQRPSIRVGGGRGVFPGAAARGTQERPAISLAWVRGSPPPPSFRLWAAGIRRRISELLAHQHLPGADSGC